LRRREQKQRTDAVWRLVRAVTPHFRGKAPEVQGAALADLLATWLAGHVVPGSEADTEASREAVLQLHLDAVRRLIPLNFKAYVAPQMKEAAKA
jgi:hypothetical protein